MSLGEQDTGLPMTGLFRRHTGFKLKTVLCISRSEQDAGLPTTGLFGRYSVSEKFHFSLEVTISLVKSGWPAFGRSKLFTVD